MNAIVNLTPCPSCKHPLETVKIEKLGTTAARCSNSGCQEYSSSHKDIRTIMANVERRTTTASVKTLKRHSLAQWAEVDLKNKFRQMYSGDIPTSKGITFHVVEGHVYFKSSNNTNPDILIGPIL